MKERLQKLMAQANIGSRRACEEIIKQGRVRVNGQTIKLGDQADPHEDVITVDGDRLVFPNKKTYIALYKPKQVVSSNVPYPDDDRPTVRSMIPVEGHLFTVGRLDADSEGLMVLTNDGELANQLTHPRYHHTKTYKVVVVGLPTLEALEKWRRGITLADDEDGTTFTTAPCVVKITDGGKETTLKIILTEGKKRQIRRIAALLGYPVRILIRTHIGRLPIGTLRPGEWRDLTAGDIKLLHQPDPDFPKPEKRVRQRPQRRYDDAPSAETSKRRDDGKQRDEDKRRDDKRPAAPLRHDDSKRRDEDKRPTAPVRRDDSKRPDDDKRQDTPVRRDENKRPDAPPSRDKKRHPAPPSPGRRNTPAKPMRKTPVRRTRKDS